MAALWYAFKNQTEATNIAEWADKLNRPCSEFRTDFLVIAESLHQQRFKFLLGHSFERHPQRGECTSRASGRHGTGQDQRKANIDLLLEINKAQPDKRCCSTNSRRHGMDYEHGPEDSWRTKTSTLFNCSPKSPMTIPIC